MVQSMGTEFQVRRLPEGTPERIDTMVRVWALDNRVGGSIADKRRAWLMAMLAASEKARQSRQEAAS